MKYQNFETLKKNSEFKSVYQAKHSYANKYIIMYILQNGTDTNRLGLYLCKKAADQLGIDIEVESEPYHGTKVLLTIRQHHTRHE